MWQISVRFRITKQESCLQGGGRARARSLPCGRFPERYMSYVKHVLLPDEQVRYVTDIHWVVYLPGAAILVLAAAAWIASLGAQSMANLWLVLAAMLAVLGLLMTLSAWFRRWTTEIAVTSKRVIYKRGFIQRRTIEMNIDKVESVDVVQSVLGRMFDFGTITVRGVGTGIEPLANIESPIEFRNHVTAG
jgi:membrane protein YdbS with pleckstrin-like domain